LEYCRVQDPWGFPLLHHSSWRHRELTSFRLPHRTAEGTPFDQQNATGALLLDLESAARPVKLASITLNPVTLH
jgi:hypothetical protein